MNERIKQLADDAGFLMWDDEEHAPVGAVVDWSCSYDYELEKFAELIVRKCLSNMEDCDGDLDFAIWKIKKEFGVKE